MWRMPDGMIETPIPGNRLSPWIRGTDEGPAPTATTPTTPTTPTTAPTTPTTTTPTKSGYRLWKGINLGGEVVTIEGKAWLSQRQAEGDGLTVKNFRRITLVMEPKPAADELKSMLNYGYAASAPKGEFLTITQKLPDNDYQVCFWVMENSAANARLFDLEVSGEVLPDVGALPLGGWAKYGPCDVTVRNGLLEVVVKPRKGTPQLMGMAIYVTSAKTVYLCDLDEIDPKVGYGKFGKKGDLGYEDKRIAYKGVESPHGLSMHPPRAGAASVSYRLSKQYRLFKGAAAFNDTVGNKGPELNFRVLGDGKVLWEKKFKQEREEANVPVSGVDLLTLEIANEGDFPGAHAVWLEPLIISE
jgi:hypothetical protein